MQARVRAVLATSTSGSSPRQDWAGKRQYSTQPQPDLRQSRSSHRLRRLACRSGNGVSMPGGLWNNQAVPDEDGPVVELPAGENDYVEPFAGARVAEGGYTPYETLVFTDIPLRHEVSVTVAAPRDVVYEAWAEPINWMEWFSPIDQMAFHEEDPNLVSMYLWYRWARTPFLELYSTLRLTAAEPGQHQLWEPQEGVPLVGALLLEDAEGGGTRATLRLSYLLPKVLWEFAGQVAVYGDVNDLLSGCMQRMAQYLGAVDAGELRAARLKDRAMIAEGFPEQRRLREEERAWREARRAPPPWASGEEGEGEGCAEADAGADAAEAPQSITPVQRDAGGMLRLNPAQARRRWRPAP